MLWLTAERFSRSLNVAAAHRRSVDYTWVRCFAVRAAGLPTSLTALLAALVVSGCGDDEQSKPAPAPDTMRLVSPAFRAGQTLPTRFTCDGKLGGVNPPLGWTRRPRDTQSQALVVTDPDAPGGTFVHWTVWGMMDRTSGLDADIPPLGLPQGENTDGENKYEPPCPPTGDPPHRYVFTIYALEEPIDAQPGAPADEAIEKIERAALARGVLTATYRR
jgi:Raf kinase inhibitor-like YbhB/YbcL family protein